MSASQCARRRQRLEEEGYITGYRAIVDRRRVGVPIEVFIQVVMANVIEPAVMGRSLNLSPLVVIASLMVWGTIWGVVGMFLCVPIMVVVLIVLAHFDATRPVAVLLSADGRIPEPNAAGRGHPLP